MKSCCEACERALRADGEAYICSFECTFCPECATSIQRICPNCGGELLLRPRRLVLTDTTARQANIPGSRPGDLGDELWRMVFRRPCRDVHDFSVLPGDQYSDVIHEHSGPCQLLSYAPLTPFVLRLRDSLPHPPRKLGNPLPAISGCRTCFFSGAPGAPSCHSLRLLGFEVSPIGLSHLEFPPPRVQGPMVRSAKGVPLHGCGRYHGRSIALVAHAMSYYRRFRERELRAAQLEGQLAKARLQTLKSQLQPHFLFNTLHSISSLMLTDVQQADRMMTRSATC